MRRHWVVAIAGVLTLGGARDAGAQTPATVAPLPRDSMHRLTVDASRVAPARRVYRTVLLRDTSFLGLGELTMTVASTMYGGGPAWLLTQQGTRGVTAVADSLVVARDDLRPLHWSSAAGVARLAAEFTADSIFGAMSSPLGKQNIALRRASDLLPNLTATDVVLGALPLAAGWTDAATLLLIDAGGATLVPATIAVEGEEHVAVPAGEFDCWVVSLETERGSARYWVAKGEPLVVRSEQILPEVAGALLTRVLVQRDSASGLPAPNAPPPSPP